MADVVEISRKFTAALNELRVPEELIAPDVEIQNVDTAVTDRSYRGADGLRQWMDDFSEVLADECHESEPIAVGDDVLVAKVRIAGRGKVSDAPIDLRFFGVMWIRHGKISRLAGFASKREALEAAGLKE
jgi:hypothetical protein